jgi:hypothetical protein
MPTVTCHRKYVFVLIDHYYLVTVAISDGLIILTTHNYRYIPTAKIESTFEIANPNFNVADVSQQIVNALGEIASRIEAARRARW